MARIRHIAIYAENPNEMAAFYIEAFDLKEIKRVREGHFTYPTVTSMLRFWCREAMGPPRGFIILVLRSTASKQPRNVSRRSNRTSKSSSLPQPSHLPNTRSKTSKEIFSIYPKKVGKFKFAARPGLQVNSNIKVRVKDGQPKIVSGR